MNKKDREKCIQILETISDDMRSDAEAFDGLPFTGRTVGGYFGNQGAAISEIAHIVKGMLRKESDS